MSELTNIRVVYRVGATIPLGDNTYANIKPDFEIGADVADGESPSEAFAKLEAFLDAKLEKKFNEVGKKIITNA